MLVPLRGAGQKLMQLGTIFRNLVELVGSVRITAILLFILIPISITGSLIPQGREYAEYVERFGLKWVGLFYRLHLNSVFTSPWFLFLIVLLGANILSCLIVSVINKKRSCGFILVHVSLVLLVVGGLMSASMRIKGELVLNEGESATSFNVGNKQILLGFELRLKDFELQYYENEREKLVIAMPGRNQPFEAPVRKDVWTLVPGTDYEFRVERFLPDFRYDMTSRTMFSASGEANNPAILVHMRAKSDDYSEWVFAHFENFHMTPERPIKLRYVWAPNIPKTFISHVEIIEEGKPVKEQAIRVNHPLRHKGFSIYQNTYDPVAGEWSGFAVVRDPGTVVIFASITIIMIGLIWNIYFHPERKKKLAWED